MISSFVSFQFLIQRHLVEKRPNYVSLKPKCTLREFFTKQRLLVVIYRSKEKTQRITWHSYAPLSLAVTNLIIKVQSWRPRLFCPNSSASANGGSGTSWKRSSLVNIRVPWLRMCQSLRRTQESCKEGRLSVTNSFQGNPKISTTFKVHDYLFLQRLIDFTTF